MILNQNVKHKHVKYFSRTSSATSCSLTKAVVSKRAVWTRQYTTLRKYGTNVVNGTHLQKWWSISPRNASSKHTVVFRWVLLTAWGYKFGRTGLEGQNYQPLFTRQLHFNVYEQDVLYFSRRFAYCSREGCLLQHKRPNPDQRYLITQDVRTFIIILQP